MNQRVTIRPIFSPLLLILTVSVTLWSADNFRNELDSNANSLARGS